MGRLTELLERLEEHYGEQTANWPVKPEQFVLWWQAGYPPSETRCAKGWESVERVSGTSARQIVRTPRAELVEALRAGGLMPEMRAARMQETAAAVAGPRWKPTREALLQVPGIGAPGVDRILLFGEVEAVAAVPSNHPQVAPRMLEGREGKSYASTYAEARKLVEREVDGSFATRQRAYLLLKRHGETICRRQKPKCEICPVRSGCAYARRSTHVE